ncbi:MAG: DUF6056 family protein [Muribaculum sp.]|nr:DUF6056 family protein [Muribaculum sp.]
MRRPSPLHIIFSSLFIAIIGLAIWWMSANVVWLGDDLDYKYMMKGEIWQSWGKIKTWHDFWQSQFTHYHHVNGRFVAHSLVQLFCGILGQQKFALFNAMAYMAFAVVLAKCGQVRFGSNCGGVFSAACLSVICFVTKMMPTCQIGYIWGMLANLLWISAFFSKGKKSWITVILMFLAGIVVGNWQESISIGVCAGLGCWWLSQFLNRHKTFHSFFDWRRSWSMLGYFIGTASNCLSPATLSRMQTETIPFADQLLVVSYSVPAILMLFLTIMILGVRHKLTVAFSFDFENGKIPNGFLITSILFLLLFNAAIGIYSNRQLFGANLFAAILMLQLLPRHRMNTFFNITAGISVAAIWTVMYVGIMEVRRQYDEIVSLHKKSEDGVVEYDRLRVMTIGHPSDAKYYEDIVGQFDNDLHHSLMKDFHHSHRGRTLKLKPTTKPDSVKIQKYAPGHFYLTTEEPKNGEAFEEITIHGHYSILGIFNIQASPRKLQITRYSRRKAPYATAIIIPEYPLYVADSISW